MVKNKEQLQGDLINLRCDMVAVEDERDRYRELAEAQAAFLDAWGFVGVPEHMLEAETETIDASSAILTARIARERREAQAELARELVVMLLGGLVDEAEARLLAIAEGGE